jgi:hypothetical protein
MKISKNINVFALGAYGNNGHLKLFNVNEELGALINRLKLTSDGKINLENILEEDYELETIESIVYDLPTQVNIYKIKDLIQIVELKNEKKIPLIEHLFFSDLICNSIIREISPLDVLDRLKEGL